ncbi:MAG: cytochrome C biogenesis protein [Sphingomonas sanxanigenens]|uniref:Cytochrome c-type biogenesis protein n=1 Tax=Sphingomonas sanxanigenens TaxID=397260 RepID=A0A2W5C7E4_9SPHN|nr:MAG: cytochrome C biogenesis protein [Sphingomonas sanxanigenens]
MGLAMLLSLGAPLFADSRMDRAAYADTQLPDPGQEARASALMRTIRCLVCQGQSIADSDAEMAGDMRAMIRRRVAAGEDTESIRRWLIARYGDWVSYAPTAAPATWPLWAAPVLLIAAGAWVARGRFRKRRR